MIQESCNDDTKMLYWGQTENIAEIADRDGLLKALKRGVLKTGLQSGLESRLRSGLESALKTALETGLKILKEIQNKY